MPRLIVTQGAARGLEYCRRFLAEKNPRASKSAGQVIARHMALLESDASIGRPTGGASDLRELIIPFGDSGYVALYRYEASKDSVYLLAFRHQKEAGY